MGFADVRVMPAKYLNLRQTVRRRSPPEPGKTTEAQIARINALTAAGRTNWFGLMAYLVFAFITALGVSDADFFIPSRQTRLPLVNVDIPTKSFFYFAPILAVALYAYLHLHIRKATAALCEVPPTVDGTPLERHISPWLLNDLVLRRRRDGSSDRMPMDWLATITTVALIWFAGPFVISAIWVRSWPAHDEWMTTIAGLCLTLSLYAGHASWAHMNRGLPSRRWRLPDPAHDALLVLVAGVVIALGTVKTEWGKVPDPKAKPWQDFRADLATEWRPLWEDGGDELAGVPSLALASFGRALSIALSPRWLTELTSARLAETQFSALPPDQNDPAAARHRYRADWCARNDLDTRVCGGSTVAGEDALAALNAARESWCGERGYPTGTCTARFRELNQSFDAEWSAHRTALIAALDKPDLRGADLRGADLASASLTGVLLSHARLDGADLRDAQMEGANLGDAEMTGADFSDAQLADADLSLARMPAKLVSARMGGVDLRGAQMEGADLKGARMQGADLRGAQLEGAELKGAKLTGANLGGSSFEGAGTLIPFGDGNVVYIIETRGRELKLLEAQFQGANLSGAQLQWADLSGAKMEGADLEGADLEGAQLDYSRLMGTAGAPIVLQSTNLSGATNNGGALRFADLRSAIFSPTSDFRNAFADATVFLSTPEDRPCQWRHELSDEEFRARWRGWIDPGLSDHEFYARWRGWLALAPDAPSWVTLAPEEWLDVAPVPPPPGCVWQE